MPRGQAPNQSVQWDLVDAALAETGAAFIPIDNPDYWQRRVAGHLNHHAGVGKSHTQRGTHNGQKGIFVWLT